MTIDDAPSLVPADIVGCDHPRVELRKKDVGGAGVQFRWQCLDCGRTRGPAVKKLIALEQYRSEADVPHWDRDLEKRCDTARTQHYRNRSASLERQRQLHEDEWWDKYKAYLQSDDWRRLREAVLQRADGLCEGCRQQRATQVHHLTYDHVGHEFLWELVAICDHCHDRAHLPHPDWLATYVNDDEVR